MADSSASLKQFFKHANAPTKLKLVGLGLLAVGAVALSAYSIYYVLLWKNRWAENNPELKAREVASVKPEAGGEHEAVTPGSVQLRYEIKNITAPMTSRDGRRTGVVQFTLLLEMPDKKAHHWMELNRARLLSLVFEVSNRFHFENFDDPKGIDNFKNEIAQSYKEAFQAHAPSALHIKDWVIQ